MAVDSRISARIEEISAAETWNRRISLIRQIPEEFGKARHQEVYAAVAQAIYVAELAPDFAYIHWRDEYELPAIERAYAKALTLTQGFTKVDADGLEAAVVAEPESLRISRLFLGFTTQELAASSTIIAGELNSKPLSNGLVKSMEAGRPVRGNAAKIAAAVIDRAMRGELFPQRPGDVRSKITKPDTVDGWQTVRRYATEKVPFPVFLHQRHYGARFGSY